MNAGQSQVVIFWVNATGTVGDEYIFFVYANKTSDILATDGHRQRWRLRLAGGGASLSDIVSRNLPAKLDTLSRRHPQQIRRSPNDIGFKFGCVSAGVNNLPHHPNGLATTYHFEWGTDNTFTTTNPDTTPPVISAVSAGSINTNSAVITWTTNEAATSQVEYGTTTGYGSSTILNSSLVTSHSVNLTGLSAGRSTLR
jgi:hypothetical protein